MQKSIMLILVAVIVSVALDGGIFDKAKTVSDNINFQAKTFSYFTRFCKIRKLF